LSWTIIFLFHIMPGGTAVNAAYCVAMLSCVWVKVGENDQKNSIMDGSCIATIPQITQLWQCSISWQTDKSHSCHSHRTHQISHPGTFGCLLE